jgi:hypothetical protein
LKPTKTRNAYRFACEVSSDQTVSAIHIVTKQLNQSHAFVGSYGAPGAVLRQEDQKASSHLCHNRFLAVFVVSRKQESDSKLTKKIYFGICKKRSFEQGNKQYPLSPAHLGALDFFASDVSAILGEMMQSPSEKIKKLSKK